MALDKWLVKRQNSSSSDDEQYEDETDDDLKSDSESSFTQPPRTKREMCHCSVTTAVAIQAALHQVLGESRNFVPLGEINTNGYVIIQRQI